MVTSATAAAAERSATASARLIEQLGHVCRDRGLPDLATRLIALQRWIAADLAGFEDELRELRRGPRMIQQAAHHLLDLEGKHLRPMCVALAAKVGRGFDSAGRQLALAVELVHTATLLHDDVVDLGETRRGAPAARVVYGNAASIFAGDWLLVEALRRIRAAAVPGLLDGMLATLDEMILAESLQLERRGRLGDTDEYFAVVRGKTASLFRWAMGAGARAGAANEAVAHALERFGVELGVAFQLVDDCLDFSGDADITGKALFADLREGKTTYPLILAAERDPALGLLLAQALADAPADAHGAAAALPDTVVHATLASLERTGALVDARALATERVVQAIRCLDVLPDGEAKDALVTVAQATAQREA